MSPGLDGLDVYLLGRGAEPTGSGFVRQLTSEMYIGIGILSGDPGTTVGYGSIVPAAGTGSGGALT